MEKRIVRSLRHSRDLLEAIEKARKKSPGAEQSFQEGKWIIKDGETILAGPSPTQWDAWMEAAEAA